MPFVRNLRKHGLLILKRGQAPLEAGEEREVSAKDLEAMSTRPDPSNPMRRIPRRYWQRWLGRVVSVSASPTDAPVPPVRRPPTVEQERVRAEVAKLLRAAAVSKSPVTEPEAEPEKRLTVAEVEALLETATLEELERWSGDERKGVQKALEARLAALAAEEKAAAETASQSGETTGGGAGE